MSIDFNNVNYIEFHQNRNDQDHIVRVTLVTKTKMSSIPNADIYKEDFDELFLKCKNLIHENGLESFSIIYNSKNSILTFHNKAYMNRLAFTKFPAGLEFMNFKEWYEFVISNYPKKIESYLVNEYELTITLSFDLEKDENFPEKITLQYPYNY